MKLLLVAYDNDSFISWFPQGLAYLAAVGREAGFEMSIYNQDVTHSPDDRLRDFLDKNHFDVVGVGACGGYYQYRRVMGLARAINASCRRPFFVLGGHLSSPDPEYFLRKTEADAVVIGEGERTLPQLLEALASQKGLSGVPGLVFREGSRFVRTAPRDLITDIDRLPFPAWDLFPMDHYTLLRMPNVRNGERCLPVLSGRGCTFTCNFCYRMDKGFRPRSPDGIVEEIRRLKSDYAVSYIVFSDELLMSSEERTVTLCEAFLRADLNVHWSCNGRLNYATPRVLDVMKKAGCVFINYGIESMDEKALRAMKKALTVPQIIAGIENTLKVGISPGFNIIFGNIGETAESLRRGVEFLLQYDDHAQLRTIRPVTPYPGSPLFDEAVRRGLLKDSEDFYENKHVNSDLLTVNFTDMSDEEFHRRLFEANAALLDRYFQFQKSRRLEEARKLYLEKDASFRGFRQS
jgi:anaerobic magnesium-protoporphyrin IX monomethyl ester cyclase